MSADLRFFDANCMVGLTVRPLPTGMPHDPPDVVAELAAHNVAEALVVHANAAERSIRDGNQEAVRLAGTQPGRLHPAWVIPQHSALDIPEPDAFIGDMLDSGVLAVRVPVASYHGHVVDEWALGPVWRELERRRVPVLIEGSDLSRYPDQPSRGFSAANIHQLCRTFPDLPVVLLRINFSCLRIIVPLLRECPNLAVEISYFTAHCGLDVLAGEAGADRILFGSGLPWTSPGPALVSVLYAGLSPADKALIAGDNLRRLLSDVRR
jgi:predicted TIM-barrel fold metal-dependent hydrolase